MNSILVYPPSKFPVGQLVATPGAHASLTVHEMFCGLARHTSGDWGDLDAHDKEVNDQALQAGGRLLSAYLFESGVRFWIITEANRQQTTILLPHDY